MTRYSLIALLVLLPLGLAACGGGGDQATQPSATGQSTTPTPMATPVITDNLFEFKDKGYSVRFPQGWTPLPNFVPAPNASTDAFFAPKDQEITNVQPNMAVTCNVLSAGTSLQQFFDDEVQIVKGVTKVDPETSSRQVSGQDALQLRFTRENVPSPIEKTEILFVTERCGWNISLTVPFSNRDTYHDPFEQFVDSFSLLH